MKFFKSILMTVAVLASATVALAQPATLPTFALTSTDIGATNSYAIIGANHAGVAEIDYLNATSDKASQVLFYTAGTGILAQYATNASQATHYFAGTGNFAANDKVILRHVSTDTYERLVVSSVAAGTVTFTANPSAATAKGDVLYKMTAGAYIPVATTTISVVGTSYRGQEGKPVYMEIEGTSACQINSIVGKFVSYR